MAAQEIQGIYLQARTSGTKGSYKKREQATLPAEGEWGGSRVGVMFGLFAGVTLLIGRTYSQLFLRIYDPVCSLLCMYHFLSITLVLQELQNLVCIFPPLN